MPATGGKPMDANFIVRVKDKTLSAQSIADLLLATAIELDGGRPADDCSVVVVKVVPFAGDRVRRTTSGCQSTGVTVNRNANQISHSTGVESGFSGHISLNK
jgi:hypothetical protein